MPITASAVVGAATGIASTISQVADAGKRRMIESNLAMLDTKQRADLERELQATNNVNARIQILVNAVSQIRSAQSSAILSSTIQAKAKREQTLAFVILGGSVAILLGVILITRR